MTIVDGAMNGEKVQPTEEKLDQLAKEVKQGKCWDEIFKGVASLDLTAKGYGPSIDLNVTKKEGIAVNLVPEGTPGAAVLAIKRVDDLGYYNLGRDQLASNLNLTGPKTTAIIRYLNLQEDPECYKRVVVGKSSFDRYSQKAIAIIKKAISDTPMAEIWQSHGIKSKKVKATSHQNAASTLDT